MSDKTESVRVGSFVGRTESGEPITIYIVHHFIVVTTRGGITRAKTQESYATNDGTPVNRTGKGTYVTLFGVAITSDDISAP